MHELPSSVLDKLEASVLDWDVSVPRFVGALYGDPGTGKTVLGAALAQIITNDYQDILLVDTSDGWISLKNHPALTKRVKVIRFQSFGQMAAVAAAIRQRESSFGKIGTIMIDEVSTIYRDATLEAAKEREAAGGSKNPGLTSGALDWRDYGVAQNFTYNMVSEFKNILDLNVICTAHTRTDDETKKTRMGLSDAIFADLSRMFQLIGYLTTDIKISRETKETFYDRKIQVHPTNLIGAKSRIGGFTSTAITHPQLMKGIKDFLTTGIQNDPGFKPMGVETETNSETVTPGIEVV